ncbi:MAG: glycosyltransferase [Quinella sp. 2Q5]|nr:glycosyltransferase [Quinella sp. 2Q5]
MKVSVIVPVFNAEKFLPVCLESLAIQTLGDFEVIVVDDCSTDNSAAIAESFLPRFDGRLKVLVLDENTGSGAVPRNVGLEHARGEYVFFVDADDFLIDTALETLVAAADEYRADVVYMEKYFMCGEEPVPDDLTVGAWKGGVLRDKIFVEPGDIAERVRLFMGNGFYWPPWTKFIRRDLLIDNDIKFPRMMISEDVVWTFELLCLAKKILRLPDPLYIQRTNTASMMRCNRTPEEMTVFRTSPLINGVDLLDEFMSGVEFFRRNEAVRLQVLNFFALMQIKEMSDALNSLPTEEAYEIFLREFAAAGSSQPALIAYLLTMNHLYRNELTK